MKSRFTGLDSIEIRKRACSISSLDADNATTEALFSRPGPGIVAPNREIPSAPHEEARSEYDAFRSDRPVTVRC